MTTDERSWWHSYVYAWRRQFLNNHDRVSPPDPEGVWFMPRLITDAHRALYGYRTHRSEVTPAMQAYHAGKFDDAERFDDQDRERRKLGERMDREGIAWRKPDGWPTPEAIEYAGLSLRQAQANTDRFVANTKVRVK